MIEIINDVRYRLGFSVALLNLNFANLGTYLHLSYDFLCIGLDLLLLRLLHLGGRLINKVPGVTGHIKWMWVETWVFFQGSLVVRICDIVGLLFLDKLFRNEFFPNVRRPKVGRGLGCAAKAFLQLTRMVHFKQSLVGLVRGHVDLGLGDGVDEVRHGLVAHILSPRCLHIE